MSNDYVPISCSFYDEFEAAAVKRINCEIIYKDEEMEKSTIAKVIDFKTKNKEEFMILDRGIQIRLDKIISFNKLKPEDKNYC